MTESSPVHTPISQKQIDEMRRRRMEFIDSLPPYMRAVANGLPRLEWINEALAAGCVTQEDAERFVREHLGESCLGFLNKHGV